MKKLLHLFTASIMLLSGCKSYDGDIETLNNRIDGLTSTQIATINEQITAIKTTIPYLEKVDDELEGYINTLEDTADDLEDAVDKNTTKIAELKTELSAADAATKAEIIAQLETATTSLKAELTKVNTTITELQSADVTLEGKIQTLNTYVDDELSDMKNWSTATFATLEQYSDLVDDVTTINGQITSLNTSVSALETSLSDTAESINNTIKTLEGDVAQDMQDLSSEITTAYTSAIVSAKSDIETAYEGAIETAIDNLESSMQTWVNEKLTGYYTIAQTQDELTALQETLEAQLATQKSYLEGLINNLGGSDNFVEDVNAMRATITNIETVVANNAKDITELKSDLATATTELTEGYAAAIDAAISTLDGKLSDDIDEVNSNLATEINTVNISIGALSDRVTTIESEITDIKNTLSDMQEQIADIMSRVQSVVYAPVYSDGNATMVYDLTGGTTTLRYKISPASVAEELEAVWESALSVEATYTRSRVSPGEFVELDILSAEAENGILTVVASGDNLDEHYFKGSISASLCLNISDGKSDISSEFVNLVKDCVLSVEISSAEELVSFGNLVRYVSAAKFYSRATLTADINLKDIDWTPIYSFGGTFDGDGHTISNLTINSEFGGQGLFSSVTAGKVENLILDNPQVSGGTSVGAICGILNSGGTITRCSVKSGSISGSSYVGGVVGRIVGGVPCGTVSECYNTGAVTGSGDNVGGVVGGAEYYPSSITITDCNNTGTVTGIGDGVGGVVGRTSRSSTITGCYNTGKVIGSGDSVGGVGGVVGYTESGAIVTDSYNTGAVTGYCNYVGGIVGYNDGNITACYNTATVEGDGDNVGGVAGYNDSTITACYNTATVEGDGDNVGGVVGYNDSIIKECHNTGVVTGHGNSVGGVAGYNDFTITACYNTATVEGDGDNVGGVAGYNNGNKTIKACYNTATVEGDGNNVGGVAGYNDGTITACYNTGETLGSLNIGGVIGGGNSTAQWIKSSYYISVYTYSAGIRVLSIDKLNEAVKTMNRAAGEVYFTANSGTILPSLLDEKISFEKELWTNITVGNVDDLKAFRDRVNGGEGNINVVLTANIDLNGEEWTPIGISADIYYPGTFDGGGYTISNLTINSEDSNQGLFGYVKGGSITNLIVDNPQIGGGAGTGAICGSISGGDISDCGVTNGSVSRIETASGAVGGVVGSISSSSVSDCYNTSLVSGTSSVGGVVGSSLSYSSVTSCYNTGSVSGTSGVAGGVVGLSSSSSSVTGCYNTGSVSGVSSVGGVVGNISMNSNSVTACYNTGSVSGTGTNSVVGGVVGNIFTAGNSVTACYNTGSVSGTGTNSVVGGVVGKVPNIVNVTSCYFVDQERDNATVGVGSYTSSEDYEYMILSSVSELNDVVSALNTAANDKLETTNKVYFTAGNPTSTHLPSLFDENFEYIE